MCGLCVKGIEDVQEMAFPGDVSTWLRGGAQREQADLDDLLSLALSWHYPDQRCYCHGCVEERNPEKLSFRDSMLRCGFNSEDSYHWIDFAYKYGKVVYEPGKEPPRIPWECGWWKRPEAAFTFPVGRRSRRRAEVWQTEIIKFDWYEPPALPATGIVCSIPGCSRTSFAPGPCRNFICSQHTRDEQFAFIKRDLLDKNKWSDRRACFQSHVLHAKIVYGASGLWRAANTANYKKPLRMLDSEGIQHAVQVLPERTPIFELPRFTEPISDEHCNAEYDRRVMESAERAVVLRGEYENREQKQLLQREISKRSNYWVPTFQYNTRSKDKYPRRKSHDDITKDPPEVDAPFTPLEADSQLHNKIILFDFPWRPTKEQTAK
jgi:hypothetical protein